MRRLAPIIPVLLILAAPPVMLWTLWVNPLSAGEDDVEYYYPLRVLVGRELAEGRWPIHNPLEATGMPLLADPQSAVLHPATWLFAALGGTEAPGAAGPVRGPLLAYALSLYIGFWLAGGGTYLYLRRIGLMRPAAAFGAVAFMFCGFLIGHRVHLGMVLAACMLPWGLWCIEGLRRVARRVPSDAASGERSDAASHERSRAVLPWLAPTIFLALAAGHWPTFVHMSLIWAAYFLLRARPLGRSLGVCAAAAALALVCAGPQLLATADLMHQATRQRIGFATAGENSFFPGAGVLAMFPFLMGSRTPNVFSQKWWGSWHQCEMLGYVGLATLVLAGAAMWRLYRKTKRTSSPSASAGACAKTQACSSQHVRSQSSSETQVSLETQAYTPLVRTWTWIAIGAGVWMLGYYLPTYRLVHMVPVLGVMRCPARMVLAVDFALAALAAIAIHLVSQGRESAGVPDASTGTIPSDNFSRLKSSIVRGGMVILPIAMVLTLVVLALAAVALRALGWWLDYSPFTVGSSEAGLAAASPLNPAVWVPAILWAATAAVLLWWSKAPARRSGLLVALLLADLFILTRYVDVPANVRAVDMSTPPAAAWLKEHAGASGEEYRVWGLSHLYCHRQRELLLPKLCCVYGISTIASYGPFLSPTDAHLLGFNIAGDNRGWTDLLRRNRLISLYNVRYILAEANTPYVRVLESVRVTAGPAMELGENLVGDDWALHHATREGGEIRLDPPFPLTLFFTPAEATTPVALEPNTIYRISLEARGPDGGAGNYLSAEVFHKGAEGLWLQPQGWGLSVPFEQIGADWRRFRWTFQTEGNLPAPWGLQLKTMSERPIEVREISLRKLSAWESPEDAGGLAAGSAVYKKVAELPPVRSGDPPVVIYENLLARDLPIDRGSAYEKDIEDLRWKAIPPEDWRGSQAPNVGLRSHLGHPGAIALAATLPGALVYVVAVVVAIFRARRRGRL